MEGHRRLTLFEQMSASADGRALAGLSLEDVLSPAAAAPKEPPPAPVIPASISGLTLLDIIRNEEPKSYKALIGKKDKKPWKTFKDRLRLKKASAAWASNAQVPTSDVPVRNNHHHHRQPGYSHSRSRNSIRYITPEPQPMAEPGSNADTSNRPPQAGSAPSFNRRSSVRFASDIESPRPKLETAISEERSLSAREAVAAQEAAEASAAAAAAEAAAAEEEAEREGEGDGASSSEKASGETVTSPEAEAEAEPVRMSLMDLLEETDRQMGLEGGRYTMDEEEEEEEEEEEVEEVEEVKEVEESEEAGGVEHSCCVCMVRHKGAAFIPCGHTFCRMCSRELWVQRGNCPLCNNFILEILDIF